MIIELSNGAYWDTSISFDDQTTLAQNWYIETLVLAIQKHESVSPLSIDWVNKSKFKDPFYNKIQRGNIILSNTGWYKFIGDSSDVQNYYNHDNWSVSKNCYFTLTVIE